MRDPFALPQYLRLLPLMARLVIFLFLLLLAVVTLVFTINLPGGHSLIPILMLPIGLGAWLFSARVTVLCLVATYIADAILATVVAHSLFWPPFVIIAFTFSSLAMTAEACGVSMLRYAVDHARIVRQKERRAEEELATALERQRLLSELKDQFFLNMSHELHTPLTELKGYIELFHEHHMQIDAATQEEFLEHIIHGYRELEQIMSNVLQTAHLDQSLQAAHYEVVNVASVLRSALEDKTVQELPAHTIQLFVPEELTVWTDRKLLRQIFCNLLSNAFKYSPASTTVTVSVEQLDARVPSVCIRVQDAGPGIPETDLPLLFGKSMRLSRDITGAVRGSGLGLYLSKQLVEGLGGSIWVESSGVPGQGSCFCITLPTSVSSPVLKS